MTAVFLSYRRNVDEKNKRLAFGPFESEAAALKFIGDRRRSRTTYDVPELMFTVPGTVLVRDLFDEAGINTALRPEDV